MDREFFEKIEREVFEYTMDFDNEKAFGRFLFPVLQETSPIPNLTPKLTPNLTPNLDNKREEDFEFSPEQADRFASFYSDLRDDIQDLHLCGHDPFLFKEMREKREAKKEI